MATDIKQNKCKN